MENGGNKRAGRVLRQLEDYDGLLNTILIGNNIVNITATSLAAILFATLIKDNQALATTVSTASLTLAILVFGEIVPKSIAKENAEKFVVFFQPLVSFFQIIFLPLSWFFKLWRKIFKNKNKVGITEEELITIVEEVESEGGIGQHESQLIRSAIEFDDVELYDIMVPRVQIIAVEDTDSMETVMTAFSENGFSRMPVYHDSLDAIVGIMHEKDFYALLREGGKNIMSIVKSSICLSRNMKISDALRTLQKAKVHMAVVVDEFGGTSGIVTMEDILEELVGEIYDEHDEEEVLSRRIDEDTFIVSGGENLEAMFEEMGIDVDEEFDSTTVGGWVTEQLKRIPIAGESFEYASTEFVVTKASNRKVIEIKATKIAAAEEDEEE
jgi:CBS domain containing-hemolysin-like protein